MAATVARSSDLVSYVEEEDGVGASYWILAFIIVGLLSGIIEFILLILLFPGSPASAIPVFIWMIFFLTFLLLWVRRRLQLKGQKTTL